MSAFLPDAELSEIAERSSRMTSETRDESSQPRKRRRPALACFECRRRKIKCDRNNPCAQCVQSKCSSCLYSSAGVAFQEKRYDGGRFSLEHKAPTSSVTNFPTPGSSPRTASGTDVSQFIGSSSRNVVVPRGDKTIDELLQRIQSLEQKLSQESTSKPDGVAEGAQDRLTYSFVPLPLPPTQPMRATLSKTRIFGPSHWMGHFQQFQKLAPFNYWSFDTSTFVTNDRYVEVCTLLDKCKKLGRVLKAQRPSRYAFSSEDSFKNLVPQRESVDQLVETYLRCFESIYRVLHIPSFQQEYNQYWKNPENASIGFVVKLLLVMAIGSSLHRNADGSTRESDALKWVYAAQTWLSVPFEKSRLNLSGLQIYCLLLIARQYVSVGPELVWISAGSLLRCAMQMGLHRDPRHFPKMSVLHSELRRRLWATILELAVQFSLDAGMPPMISFSDFNTEPPSNINDTDIDEMSLLPPISKPSHIFTQTSIQITLLKSLRARLEVSRIANDLDSEPPYDKVLQLSSEIMNACRDVSALFKSTAHQNLSPSEFHHNLTDYLLRRFLLTLHHPFAFKSSEDPRFYFSRKVCLESALIVSCPSEDKDYHNLTAIGGGLFRALSCHAAITFWYEIIIQQREDDSSGVSNRSGQNASRSAPIRAACKNLVSMLEERLKHGETNVKGYMFGCMVIGQLEAIEAGESQENAIFESATKSIRCFYETLRKRLHPATEDPLLGNEKQQGIAGIAPDNGEVQELGYEFLQDGAFNFEFPDSWLFYSGWDENSWIV